MVIIKPSEDEDSVRIQVNSNLKLWFFLDEGSSEKEWVNNIKATTKINKRCGCLQPD
jgi:hypothetical protein